MYTVQGVIRYGIWEDGKRLQWLDKVDNLRPTEWHNYKFQDETEIIEAIRGLKLYK